MASEQEILDQATKLGELIAEHDAVKSFESAAKAFEADPSTQRTMTDYQRFAQALQQKAQQGSPIEVEDKRKLEELKQAMITNPLLASLKKAEMDYVDLLRKVDAVIVGAGGAGAVPGGADPSGSAGSAGSVLGG